MTNFWRGWVEGRDLPLETVADIAQGRVWSGKSAQQLGLVDELGGLDRAIALAAELAELEDDWQLQQYPEADEWQRFFETFLTQGFASPATVDPIRTQVNRLLDDLSVVRTLNDPQGIYLLMPFTLRVE
jgi:protease-4